MDTSKLHPGIRSLLSFFDYDLPGLSDPCGELAAEMAERLGGTPHPAELTAGLRKLLEAKDCFLRAAKGIPGAALLILSFLTPPAVSAAEETVCLQRAPLSRAGWEVVVPRALGGECSPALPAAPQPEFCSACEWDRILAAALERHWAATPDFFRLNEHYGELASRWLETLHPDAVTTPRQIREATRGGGWHLAYYLGEIADCRGAGNPCLGRKLVPVGPARNTFVCQFWVMTREPKVEAMLRIARDSGWITEGPKCPPSASFAPSFAAAEAPDFFTQEPDPALYPLPAESR